MADKNLSVPLTVEVDVNTKKLDAIAKHIGMTGDKLRDALDLEVDFTSLTLLGQEIGKLESRATSLGTTLSTALGGNPAGQQELLDNLRQQLVLANKIKEANSQPALPKRSGKQVDIKQAIAEELFGDKSVKFNVGAYKSEVESRTKGFSDEFGQDSIDIIEVVGDAGKTLLQELNLMAQEAADRIGIKFKSSTEMLTGFNASTLEDSADATGAALKAIAQGLELSSGLLVNGQRFAEKDLVNSIRDFEVNAQGVFTVSPAMLLDAYKKVIAKFGPDLVTENLTDYKDLKFKPFQTKVPDQVSQNVIDYLQKALQEISSKPGGQAKIDQKIFSIEEKILNVIFQNALKAAERTLTDSKGFDRRQLDIYAPSADVSAIAGSADTENLMRYAEEAAAKSAYKDELALGLEPGTAAKFLLLNFSTRFQDAFQDLASNPNALFDPAKVIGAIRATGFTDDTGTLLGSALSRGLDGIKPISEQILANPGILQGLIGVDESALQKKIDILIQQKIAKGTFEPGDIQEAVALAYVQSLIGQIVRTKPINYADAIKASELQAKKDYEEQEKEKSRAFISSGGARRNSGLDNLSAGQAAKQKEINKAVGEANALRIALLREGFVEAGVEALVAKKLQADIANRIARVKAENKAAGQERARQIAIERQAGIQTQQAAAPVVEALPTAEALPKGNYFDRIRALIIEQRDAYEKLGLTLVAALDTEFNPALEQFVTELNLKIKTVDGKFVDLLSFIHIPTDAENLALDPSPKWLGNARSVKDLEARAAKLGLDMTKLGSLDNPSTNKTELYGKVKALVDIITILDEAGVGLTGSSFAGAEGANIAKMIRHVNLVSGMPPLEIPKGMGTAWDSVTAFNEAKKNQKNEEIRLVTESGSGLGSIMAGINKYFSPWLEQFKDVLVMSENGPITFGATDPKTGKPSEIPAHYSANDTIQSLIVRAFYEQFTHAVDKVMSTVVDGVKPSTSKPATTKSSGGSGGSGGGPGGPGGPGDGGDDPAARRKRIDAEKSFHSEREMLEQLQARLTEEELFLVKKRLDVLKKDAEQIETATKLIAVQAKIAEARTPEAIRARSDKSNPNQASLVAEYEALVQAEMDLTNEGRKRELQVVQLTLSERRYKDMQEPVRENTRKQIDAEADRAQAGKRFSAQIQAQLKAELEAQKAVQKANREQLNQWVTARYALYDVGNFYQNVAQQLGRVSAEIFRSTETYRSFETAFTSVERAMQLPTDAAIDMRNSFIRMSESLPVTFEELSRIATLGAQMGIGAGGISDFTETIAKFSSITTISAETVAQKFGRIAELANVDSSQFSNLGSAVAFAGVNAVATESEILTLTESIAAVSAQAGMTPSEIVGISTALASVGIQAEQARGVFTRVFADIDRAVSRGGSELTAFAKVSGMSSDDFAKQWGTEGESYNVFRKLLAGLGSSANVTKTFDALNIVETREINTLTRLAQNLGVVDRAVSDSNESFAEGTFLASSFEKTADNLDAKIVIFKNNIDSLVVSISGALSPALKFALDTGSRFIEVLKDATNAPFAQAILPIALGLTSAGAGVATLGAGFSKLIAQIYAFRVANINQMNGAGVGMDGVINKLKQLSGAYSGLIEVRSGLGGNAGVEQKGVIAPVTFSAKDEMSWQKDSLSEIFKTNSVFNLKRIQEITGQNAAIGRQNDLLKTSNILLISAADKSKQAVEDARSQADMFERLIQSRAAANAEEYGSDAVALAKANATKFYAEIVGNEAVEVSASTVATLENEIASGRLTGQKLAEAQARRANIKQINAETQTATTATASLASRALGLAFNFIGVAGAVFSAVTMVQMLASAMEEANRIDLMASGGGLQSLRDAIAEDTETWKKTGEAVSTVQVEYTSFEKVAYKAFDSISAINGANDKLKKSSNEVTEIVKYQTQALGENTKNWILNSIISNDKVNEWLDKNKGLFSDGEAALQQYGMSFKELVQDIMAAPSGDGVVLALSKVDTALQNLEEARRRRLEEWNRENPEQADPSLPTAQVKNPDDDPVMKVIIARREALKKVRELLREIGNALAQNLSVAALRKSLAEALGGLDKELDNGLQKTVKTLTQWSSEVAQIIQSALTIRRQKQVGLDGITKAWSDMRKQADEARKAVKKAQDQINSLKASRSTLEYQLNIAIKYGDSKRAAEIQAKLDENTTSLADANDQLTEAQNKASTEVKGNSDAAIENRAKLRALVDTYVPYIQALENSTVKGETFAQKQDRIAKRVAALKAEFESQALALGFAQTDLAAYLGDFDAMGTVVKKVPNTVTVKVDGLPAALRALREFASQANTILNRVAPDAKTLALNIINAEIAQKQALLSGYNDLLKASKTNSDKLRYVNIIDRIGIQLASLKSEAAALSVKKAAGGYISGPGTPTSDSIPAMLSNGEYVVKASTVRKVGVAALNDLNENGSVAKFASGGYVDRRDAAWAARSGPVDKRDRTMSSRYTPTKLEQWIRSRNNRLLGNTDWQLDGKRRFGLTDAQMQAYIKSQTASQISANAGRSTASLQLNALAKDKSGPMEAARLAAYFVPGVGLGLSVSDIDRAAKKNDLLGTGFASLGALPGVGGLFKLAGFAGKGSKLGSTLNSVGNNIFKYAIDLPAKLIAKAVGAAGKPIMSAANKFGPRRPASGAGKVLASAPGVSVSTGNQMDAAIGSMTNKQLKQAIAGMYNRKNVAIGNDLFPAYSIGGDGNRFVFQGVPEHFFNTDRVVDPSVIAGSVSKALNAPASVVSTTPQGLLEAALKINPKNKKAQTMLNNFQQKKIGKKELELLDQMIAAVSVGKNGKLLGYERTDGFAEVLSSLAGNKNATNLLGFKTGIIRGLVKQNYKDSMPKRLPKVLREADPDTIPVIHSSKYPVARKEDGSIDLFAMSQHRDDYARSSLHFTLEDTVKSHLWGQWTPDEIKVISSLSSMMKNNGAPRQMATNDTWWLRNPGQPLTLTDAAVIRPYTDKSAYTAELIKRGLLEEGKMPPMMAVDPKTKDVLHLYKPEYSPVEQEQIRRMMGYKGTPAQMNEFMHQQSIQEAKKLLGIKTQFSPHSEHGVSNTERRLEITDLANRLRVKQEGHTGTNEHALEDRWGRGEPGDNQYNMTHELGGFFRAKYAESLEALRTVAWKGKFYTFQKDIQAWNDQMLRNKGIKVSGDAPEGATGGYISGSGTGTSDSITAKVSNGEYVMSAKSVDTYGVDFMNALNQSRVMYAPARPSTVQSGGGSSVVYLSPDDRALLRAAIDRPVNLYADSTKLAQSVNNGNKVLAQRGSN